MSRERVVREAWCCGLRLAAALRAPLILRASIAVLLATAAGTGRGASAAGTSDLRFATALGAERDALAYEVDLQHPYAELISDFDDLVWIRSATRLETSARSPSMIS